MGERRRHDDFKENRRHRFGRFLVAFPIHRDDAAERRFAVRFKRAAKRLGRRFPERRAARIRVLHDDASRLVLPFRRQIPGRFHVDDIVVREFFPVELARRRDTARCFRIFVKRRFLMRIFPIAQLLDFCVRHGQHVRHFALARRDFLRQEIRDGTIVEPRMQIRFLRKGEPEIFIERPGIHPGNNFFVLRRIDDNRHIFVILRRRAHHGRPADIDIFDGFFQRDAGLGNRFPERIQIDADEINADDAVLFHRGDMRRIVADGQNPAVNFRMQRLHTPVHHLRKSRHIGHGHDRNAGLGNGFHRAAGGNEGDAARVKRFGEIDDSRLVGNAQ